MSIRDRLNRLERTRPPPAADPDWGGLHAYLAARAEGQSDPPDPPPGTLAMIDDPAAWGCWAGEIEELIRRMDVPDEQEDLVRDCLRDDSNEPPPE